MKTILKTLPLAVLLGACSFVPKYEQPSEANPTTWMHAALQAQAQGQDAATLQWQNYFKDPQLRALIEIALQHNHDLQVAALNTQKAAETYHIQRLDQLPTINATGDVTRSRTGQASSSTRQAYESTAYQVGLGFTSFELDFFGRVRALSESALNTYLQTREAQDAAKLSVIQSVAQGYYSARIDKALMDLSQKVMETHEKSLQLAKLQFNAGVIDSVTLQGYQNQIASARASYFAYQRAYEQALNGLSVVLGKPYTQLQLPPAESLSEQFAQLKVPANIPSNILAVRPDIREAEYALKAANADIGAAKSALFPTISLTGSLGYASAELDDLLKGPNSFWSIGPSVTFPIFNRGQLRSEVKISEIEQKILVEQYRAAVESAFQEVGNALIARQTYAEQYQSTKAAADAEANVLQLQQQKFRAGIVDGMDLLTAESNNFTAQQEVLTTQLSLLQNLVALYTAMGGGLADNSAG